MFDDLMLQTSDLLLDLGQSLFGECWHESSRKKKNGIAKPRRLAGKLLTA